MVTITLPPELEQLVTEQAQQKGTTPELLTLDKLRELLLPATPPPPPAEGLTMADFFDGYAGGLHSSEFVPGGAHLPKTPGVNLENYCSSNIARTRRS